MKLFSTKLLGVTPNSHVPSGSADDHDGEPSRVPNRGLDSTPRAEDRFAPKELYARVLCKESEIRRIAANYHQATPPATPANFPEFAKAEGFRCKSPHLVEDSAT
jgi:hypothetical protein